MGVLKVKPGQNIKRIDILCNGRMHEVNKQELRTYIAIWRLSFGSSRLSIRQRPRASRPLVTADHPVISGHMPAIHRPSTCDHQPAIHPLAAGLVHRRWNKFPALMAVGGGHACDHSRVPAVACMRSGFGTSLNSDPCQSLLPSAVSKAPVTTSTRHEQQ